MIFIFWPITSSGEGDADKEAVPWHSAHPAEAVQAVPEADCVHCAQGQVQGPPEAVQGGADEEDSHVGHAVWEDNFGHGPTADCEYCTWRGEEDNHLMKSRRTLALVCTKIAYYGQVYIASMAVSSALTHVKTMGRHVWYLWRVSLSKHVNLWSCLVCWGGMESGPLIGCSPMWYTESRSE